MYKIYGNPGSGSACVEAALAVIGAPHEIVIVDTRAGAHLSEHFGKINPRRQIPALMLPDGTVMTEGAAMMLHLADAFPKAGLAPQPGSSARAIHDRWLVFMAVNIYEGELRKGYPDRYTDDPAGAGAVQSSAEAYVARQYALVEDAVQGEFLLGETLTVADIYLWMGSSWVDQQWLADGCPKIKALADRVKSHPAIAPIAAVHAGYIAAF